MDSVLSHPNMPRRRRTRAALAAVALALIGLGPLLGATITVDSTFDDFDLGPNGNCTLREAVRAANTNSAVDACSAGEPAPGVTDRIVVPAGTYTLSIGSSGEDSAAEGDLDLTDAVEIEGAGARVTLIDGGGIDRVFDVDPAGGGMPATLLRLTVQGGVVSADGGGVRNGGTLTIDRCAVAGNSAGGPGGGVRNDVDLFVLDSAITGNTTADHGGGVDDHGQSFFQNVTVSGNSVTGGGAGGGLYNLGGTDMTVMATTVVGNSAANGSAIHNGGTMTASHLLVVGQCNGQVDTSNGASLESPGDTCGLDADSDQTAVAAPQLGALADNGGDTDSHLPLSGSPAIDTGENGLCPLVDQRQVPRPFDGDGDTIADCDTGAVEWDLGPFIFSDDFESGDTSAWEIVVP